MERVVHPRSNASLKHSALFVVSRLVSRQACVGNGLALLDGEKLGAARS